MEKENLKALTDRQEKLLKTVIVRILTDKAQGYLNDKAVVKVFPIISEMTEGIITEFNESNLVDQANRIIREDLDKEKFPEKCTGCCE